MTRLSNYRNLRSVSQALFLLLLLCAAVLSQEPQRKSDSQSDQQQNQEHKSKNEPKSLAGELAQETREAAGEDENAQFKKSASIKWVARKTGLSPGQVFWISVFLNFAVVAAAIIWVSKKFLPGVFRDRTTAIQKSMEEARNASADARRRLADIETRLSRLDIEIREMSKQSSKESAEEESRIKAAAEEDARKIVNSAEQEIAAALKQARRDLAAYAADLAISQAQSGIRVDADTDHALVRGFAEQISAPNSRPGAPPAPKKGGG